MRGGAWHPPMVSPAARSGLVVAPAGSRNRAGHHRPPEQQQVQT